MIQVGRFAIFGDWDAAETPEGCIRIILPPLGHVYGGGWQEYTQNAMLAIESELEPGQSFLEIGAGSGILSIVAKKLGAGTCYATELDKDALEVAGKAFELNGVDVNLIEGTFINDVVDLAVVSISSDFASENLDKVNARKVIVINDDASVDIV